MLAKLGGERLDLLYKLDFKVSNKKAEYEAIILGLMAVINIGASRLCVKGDSKLEVNKP